MAVGGRLRGFVVSGWFRAETGCVVASGCSAGAGGGGGGGMEWVSGGVRRSGCFDACRVWFKTWG